MNRTIKVLCCNGNAIFGGIPYQEKFQSGTNVESKVQDGAWHAALVCRLTDFSFPVTPANERPVANHTRRKLPIHPALSLSRSFPGVAAVIGGWVVVWEHLWPAPERLLPCRQPPWRPAVNNVAAKRASDSQVGDVKVRGDFD